MQKLSNGKMVWFITISQNVIYYKLEFDSNLFSYSINFIKATTTGFRPFRKNVNKK